MAYCGVMKTEDNPAERVRERIRRWMDMAGLDQRAFAASVGKTQVWLQKVLSGGNQVRLRDLDRLAQAMRTTASELVRDEAERYQLECSPTEVRLIERLRRRPDLFDAMVTILDIRQVPSREPTGTVRKPSVARQ